VRSQKANASYPAGSSRLNTATKSDSPFGTIADQSAHGNGLHKGDSSNSMSSTSDGGTAAATAAAPASTANNASSRCVVREHAAPERRPTVRMSADPVLLESTAGQQSIV
jgi:hypothetical protein